MGLSTYEPLYQKELTVTLLNEATEMYLYLVNCHNEYSFKQQLYYADFFQNASPRTIVLAILNANRLNEIKDSKQIPFPKEVTKIFVEKIDSALKLDIGKLDVAHLTQTSLSSRIGNAQFGYFRKSLQDCLHETRCRELTRLMKSLGSLQ